MSSNKWTANIQELEVGALYVMTNRGKWHVDVFPKDAISRSPADLAPDTWRAQFIGHPETLYYGPIPWPARGLRNWPSDLPPPRPVNVIKFKNK